MHFKTTVRAMAKLVKSAPFIASLCEVAILIYIIERGRSRILDSLNVLPTVCILAMGEFFITDYIF